jgi:hypothetical protein
LHIVGACPRCGGALDFLVPIEDDDSPDVTGQLLAPVADDQRAPATVLGTPLRR